MSTLGGARWQAANAELDRALDLSGEERLAWLRVVARPRRPGSRPTCRRCSTSTRLSKAARFLEEASRDPADHAHRTGSGRAHWSAWARPRERRCLRRVSDRPPARPRRHGRRLRGRRDRQRPPRRAQGAGGPRHDARERERFHREGRLAASLNHPHCVFVFAASEIDGRLAIAMELMQGTLADRLEERTGRCRPAAAVDATLQLIVGPPGRRRDRHPPSRRQAVELLRRRRRRRQDRRLRHLALAAPDARRRRSRRADQVCGHAGLRIARAAPRRGARHTGRHLQPGRHAVRAADRAAAVRARRSDGAADGRRQRRAPAAARRRAGRAQGPEPGGPALSGEAAGAALLPTTTRWPRRSSLTSTAAPASDAGPAILRRGHRQCAPLVGQRSHHPLVGPGLDGTRPSAHHVRLEVLYYAVCETRWAATPGKAISGVVIVQQGGAPARASQALVRAIVYVLVPAWPIVALLLFGLANRTHCNSPSAERSFRRPLPAPDGVAESLRLPVSGWPLDGRGSLLHGAAAEWLRCAPRPRLRHSCRRAARPHDSTPVLCGHRRGAAQRRRPTRAVRRPGRLRAGPARRVAPRLRRSAASTCLDPRGAAGHTTDLPGAARDQPHHASALARRTTRRPGSLGCLRSRARRARRSGRDRQGLVAEGAVVAARPRARMFRAVRGRPTASTSRSRVDSRCRRRQARRRPCPGSSRRRGIPRAPGCAVPARCRERCQRLGRRATELEVRVSVAHAGARVLRTAHCGAGPELQVNSGHARRVHAPARRAHTGMAQLVDGDPHAVPDIVGLGDARAVFGVRHHDLGRRSDPGRRPNRCAAPSRAGPGQVRGVSAAGTGPGGDSSSPSPVDTGRP